MPSPLIPGKPSRGSFSPPSVAPVSMATSSSEMCWVKGCPSSLRKRLHPRIFRNPARGSTFPTAEPHLLRLQSPSMASPPAILNSQESQGRTGRRPPRSFCTTSCRPSGTAQGCWGRSSWTTAKPAPQQITRLRAPSS